MTEACAWTADFYFDVLGFERMRVPKAIANRASRRISERMGMHLFRLEERRPCLRPPALRGLGDLGGGVAGVESGFLKRHIARIVASQALAFLGHPEN